MTQRKLILRIGISVGIAICGLVFIFAAKQHDPTSNSAKLRSHKTIAKGKDNDSKDTTSETKKDTLLNYFKLISGNKTISGLYYNEQDSTNFEIPSVAGVFPGIVTTAMPIYSAGAKIWQSFINETISRWENRYLVHILLGLHECPLTSNSTYSLSNETDWKDLITENGRLNNMWKKELDNLSHYLQQLQTAGVVPICDVLPFINLKWEGKKIWNGRPGLNGSLKLYQMTLDYLKRHHDLNSIIWALSVDGKENILTLSEEYWPGSNYVDVVSFYMGAKKQLTTAEYEKVLDLVGDKPISMEWMFYDPTPQILAAQPRWTWFTYTIKYDGFFEEYFVNATSTFNSALVINRGNNAFFNNSFN